MQIFDCLLCNFKQITCLHITYDSNKCVGFVSSFLPQYIIIFSGNFNPNRWIGSHYFHDDVIRYDFYTLMALYEGSHRWIPLTEASDAERWCFLRFAPEQTVEQTIETAIWPQFETPSHPLWLHRNGLQWTLACSWPCLCISNTPYNILLHIYQLHHYHVLMFELIA